MGWTRHFLLHPVHFGYLEAQDAAGGTPGLLRHRILSPGVRPYLAAAVALAKGPVVTHQRGVFRNAAMGIHGAILGGVLFTSACLALCTGRADATLSVGQVGTKEQALSKSIDQRTAEVAKNLSPAAREAMQASLARFYQWVLDYCGVSASTVVVTDGAASCIDNELVNYLAAVPQFVYRVGRWTVYDTSGVECPTHRCILRNCSNRASTGDTRS